MSVSVVVPTYNRAMDLDRCIRSLQQQTADPSLFDVIVVDDGSSDSTEEVLERWARQWVRFQYIRQENSGPAAARNAGVARARGDIVAFTDDDCVPDPDWVRRIVDHFKSGVHGCLHGPVNSSLPSSTFVHSVIADGAVITSNLAVDKQVFDAIGVFDTGFRAPWCEDADFYYRLKKASITIAYDPQLIVDHPPRYQRFWSFLRKARFYQYYALIARKHPDMEPLSVHSGRLLLALKKILVILGLIAVLMQFSVPFVAAVILAPAVFWLLDAYRLLKIKSTLSKHGIRVRISDQVLYVLLNWTANLVESYYLLKGGIIHSSRGTH